MAVKNFDELLAKLKERVGEETDDDTLNFIEDFTDTFKDLEDKTNDNWKDKYIENDKSWRQKYKDRFFNHNSPDEQDLDVPDDIKPLSYDNLFKEEK